LRLTLYDKEVKGKIFLKGIAFFSEFWYSEFRKRKRRYERQNMKTFTAEIKSRGQLTIPKKIRVMSHLEEGQIVSIIPVGDSVIIAPKRLELDDARREIKRMLKETGVSLDELLAGLKEEREKLYQDTYGEKTS
jgi:AbrB family looped-hinge helix DNA binding protein